MFLNLSNHPSSKWDAAQLAAAKMRGGVVEDMTFPAVVDFSEAGIQKLTEEVVEAIGQLEAECQNEVTTGLIAGHFGLVVEIMLALPRIEWLYANSVRNVIDLPNGEKVVKFNFDSFGEFPPIKLAE